MLDATLERVVPARLPEVGILRREAGAFVRESDEPFQQRLILVVSELCTNAIEALANPLAEFTLRVHDLGDHVVVEVEDEGPGFGEAVLKPGASDNDDRGRGLAVVQSIVNDFSVTRRRGRTVVRCVLVR